MDLEIHPVAAVWWMAVVQVAGLTSALLARVSEGSGRQSHYQSAFLVLLALVGMTTVAAALSGPGPALMSGTTLAVMVLAATWDFSAGRKVLAR